MNNKPQLSAELNIETFKQFYYLKEELVCFCRDNGLQTTGSKAELTERIATNGIGLFSKNTSAPDLHLLFRFKNGSKQMRERLTAKQYKRITQ